MAYREVLLQLRLSDVRRRLKTCWSFLREPAGAKLAVAVRMRTEVDLNRIAYEINGSGMTIHTRVGPGCFESAYVPCFACELRRRKLEFCMKVPLTLRYDDVVVEGAYQADFIVERSVIVEIKALERLAPVHSRQLQTYMRLAGCPLGLILNFGAARLADGIKRQVNNFPVGTPPYAPDVPPRRPARAV